MSVVGTENISFEGVLDETKNSESGEIWNRPDVASGLGEVAVDLKEDGLTGVINYNRLIDPSNPRSLAEFDISLPEIEGDLTTSEMADRTKEVYALSRNPETFFEVDVKSDVTLEDLKAVTPEGVWKLAKQESDTLIQSAVEADRDAVIVRMGSTYEGGGVAKLVPPFIHYINLIGAEATANGSPQTAEAHWLVGPEDPSFFDTKKLHNLQQDMLPEDETFTDSNKKNHTQLGEDTFNHFKELDVFKYATVYICDDFQYVAMLPKLFEYIDKFNPGAKVYVRNHINSDQVLMATEGTEQHEIKEYLHEVHGVKDVDGYWAHLREFAPEDAPNLTMMQPPLDHYEDLMRSKTQADRDNKLDWTDRQIERQNLMRQKQWAMLYDKAYGAGNWDEAWAHVDDIQPLDRNVPWFLGHARFDWAKLQHLNMELQKRVVDRCWAMGIPDELIPIAPIFGNGATDDKDRKRVLERMHWFVRNKYAAYQRFIAVAGMEHDYFAENIQIDQSQAIVHLSKKEGWEQIPTQAILNRSEDETPENPAAIPAIVSDGGGLPHQVKDNVTGLVIRHIDQAVPGYEDVEHYVPPGSELDTEMDKAADFIVNTILNPDEYAALKMRTHAQGQVEHRVEGLTIANWVRIGRAMNGKVDGLSSMYDIAKKEGFELVA